MTAPASHWPATLPDRPSRSGTREQAPNLRVESRNDIGPPKTRRKATVGERELVLVYELDEAQVAVLDEFYLTTLKSGALPYRGFHPRDGSSVVMMMKEPEYAPRGGQEWVARFEARILVS